jgi:hypothetical protein
VKKKRSQDTAFLVNFGRKPKLRPNHWMMFSGKNFRPRQNNSPNLVTLEPMDGFDSEELVVNVKKK